MSQSVIACRKCRKPLAVKHHSGRIAVHPDVNVVIAPAGVELKCGCGTTRYILNRPANGLWKGDGVVVDVIRSAAS